MPLNLASEYRAEIDGVAASTGVDAALIVELLALESRHQNLHGWGARPQLRREIAEIIGRVLAAEQAPNP